MIGEGLKMLTYPRHLWLLSSDDSLACHTYVYCVMGHPFIMVISEDPWHSHLLQRVWQCCHYLFLRLRSSNTQSSACAANALTHCATAAAPIESCAILHFEDTCIPFTPKFFVPSWNSFKSYEDFQILSIRFCYFIILSPWKRLRSFICKKLNPFYPKMLWAKFCGNWL